MLLALLDWRLCSCEGESFILALFLCLRCWKTGVAASAYIHVYPLDLQHINLRRSSEDDLQERKHRWLQQR